LQAEESYFFEGNDTLLSQIFYNQNTEIIDHTLRIDNTWEVNPKTRLNFGYWFSNYQIGNEAQNQIEILQESTQQGQLHAVYTELERDIGRLSFKTGLRVSYYDQLSQYFFEPRLSLNYNLSDRLIFKAGYSTAHQVIRRLNERSLYLSVPETWVLSGDETIPVLRNDHYIVGFTLSNDKWMLDVEGYHKYERGSVEFLFPEFGSPSGNLDQFENDGKRKIFGVDALLKRSFNNQNILLSYSFLNAQSKFNGINNDLFFTSTGSSAHELNAVYSLDINNWSFSGALVVASGEPYTPALGTIVVTLPNGEQQQFVSLGEPNSERLDWVHRLDISAGYVFALKNGALEVGASVYNVYNNQSIKYIDYFRIPKTDSDLYELGERNIPSLGITPSVFVKLKL
jgi:outer membrane receptor for ferrienterochelin and colicin